MGLPFQTTIWTSIRQAKEGRSTALNDFAGKYREPVVAFIRRRGHSPEDAEDLAQEVFMIVFRDQLLARAEESKGRFRSFLLAVVQNVLRNAGRIRAADKRGGGRRNASLDAPVGEDASLASILPAAEPDEDFDREWAHHLVRLALDRLAKSGPKCHEALRFQMVEGLDYAEIGRRMKIEPRQVEYLLDQAKGRMAELLRSEIAAYCSSAGEFEEETSRLGRHLRKGPG